MLWQAAQGRGACWLRGCALAVLPCFSLVWEQSPGTVGAWAQEPSFLQPSAVCKQALLRLVTLTLELRQTSGSSFIRACTGFKSHPLYWLLHWDHCGGRPHGLAPCMQALRGY